MGLTHERNDEGKDGKDIHEMHDANVSIDFG